MMNLYIKSNKKLMSSFLALSLLCSAPTADASHADDNNNNEETYALPKQVQKNDYLSKLPKGVLGLILQKLDNQDLQNIPVLSQTIRNKFNDSRIQGPLKCFKTKEYEGNIQSLGELFPDHDQNLLQSLANLFSSQSFLPFGDALSACLSEENRTILTPNFMTAIKLYFTNTHDLEIDLQWRFLFVTSYGSKLFFSPDIADKGNVLFQIDNYSAEQTKALCENIEKYVGAYGIKLGDCEGYTDHRWSILNELREVPANIIHLVGDISTQYVSADIDFEGHLKLIQTLIQYSAADLKTLKTLINTLFLENTDRTKRYNLIVDLLKTGELAQN